MVAFPMPVVELRNVRCAETPSVLVRMSSTSTLTAPAATGRLRVGRVRAFTTRCDQLLASLLLEVVGGMGAIWGCAELSCVRSYSNGDAWRAICGVAGLFFLARWVCVHALRIAASREAEAVSLFILQFLGGASAWWGFSDFAGLRTDYPADCHDVEKYGGSGDARWTPGYDECRNSMLRWRIISGAWLPWFFIWWHREQFLALRASLHLSVGGDNTARYARAAVWCGF